MVWQVSEFHSLKDWNILLYRYIKYYLSVHPSVDTCCFQLLVVANMCCEHSRTMSAYSESLLLIPLGIYPGVELLDYMNALMFQALSLHALHFTMKENERRR